MTIDLDHLEAVARAATPELKLTDPIDSVSEFFNPAFWDWELLIGNPPGMGVWTRNLGISETEKVAIKRFINTFDPVMVLAMIGGIRILGKSLNECEALLAAVIEEADKKERQLKTAFDVLADELIYREPKLKTTIENLLKDALKVEPPAAPSPSKGGKEK